MIVLTNEQMRLETDHPLAGDSPDHLYPFGTAQDNSTNKRFNEKLFRLFNHKPFYELRILDLGCSGGGFVKSCLDRGCFAMGLEGSDFSKRRCRAEWPLLQDKYLFTCDITYPFRILSREQPVKFDVITSWEVLEHLPETRIDTVIDNIINQLDENGLVILSISPDACIINNRQLHQCVKNREWWLNRFESKGLYEVGGPPVARVSFGRSDLKSYFNQHYVRGPKQNAPGSFHLHLSLHPENIKIPRLSFKERCLDHFYGSWLHRKCLRICTTT